MMTDNETVTPDDIQAALNKCSELNQREYRWATMEIIRFRTPNAQGSRIVRVYHGQVRFDGTREVKLQTYTYWLDKFGYLLDSVDTHV